jgi:hypothetical protein
MTEVQNSPTTFQEPLLTNSDVTFDDDAYLMTMMEADALLPSMTFSGLFDVSLNAEELKGMLTLITCLLMHQIGFFSNANPCGAPVPLLR